MIKKQKNKTTFNEKLYISYENICLYSCRYIFYAKFSEIYESIIIIMHLKVHGPIASIFVFKLSEILVSNG